MHPLEGTSSSSSQLTSWCWCSIWSLSSCYFVWSVLLQRVVALHYSFTLSLFCTICHCVDCDAQHCPLSVWRCMTHGSGRIMNIEFNQTATSVSSGCLSGVEHNWACVYTCAHAHTLSVCAWYAWLLSVVAASVCLPADRLNSCSGLHHLCFSEPELYH